MRGLQPHVLVSVSGGKDSTATLLVALERRDRSDISAVFCDTGNEHEMTYDYVRYLGEKTGVPVHWLKQDFTDWWWRKFTYIQEKWPAKGVPEDVVLRALAVMAAGPTGNPFLDLCIIKTRFPSRMAQFCTQYLKSLPAVEYATQLLDCVGPVESWQGVRAEESPRRAAQPEWEDRGGGLTIVRPIHKWTAAMVFAKHDEHGVAHNPLYRLGMGRVGCMPCINAKKDELLEIGKRFPEHIDRIEEWEAVVAAVSKRSSATFFATDGDSETAMARGNIRQVITWSKTKRGGKVEDPERLIEPAMCASAYGLCE